MKGLSKTVYGANVVAHIFSCKAYSRAIRAHSLVDQASILLEGGKGWSYLLTILLISKKYFYLFMINGQL